MDCLKVCLVAKGYTQIYGFDYYDTFSLIAKMASVCLLLSMAAMSSSPLYRLGIKNAFLHGDEANTWFCCSGGVWFGMQAPRFLIWP